MRRRTARRRSWVGGVLAVLSLSCAPRVRPLPGAPAPAVLPKGQLPSGHRHIVFRWELDEPDMSSRGEGAARIAAPDSARLDFFLSGGLGGGGAAVLLGNDLRLPSRGDDLARRVVPPPPLLWATLGRLAVPALRDTVARVDADTLRADIGNPIAWRLTFVRDSLRRVERIENNRVTEWVERFADGHVRYRHQVSRRQLDLFITRSTEAGAFDPSIWSFP